MVQNGMMQMMWSFTQPWWERFTQRWSDGQRGCHINANWPLHEHTSTITGLFHPPSHHELKNQNPKTFRTPPALSHYSQICQSIGFKGSKTSAFETLTAIAAIYLQNLAKSAASFATSSGRTHSIRANPHPRRLGLCTRLSRCFDCSTASIALHRRYLCPIL
ncbi:hypothetical protein L1049_010683 [Liquidambar formosana]|uniref:Bromodomain associated domain-containing protein n=1 Tax=Liquidambar formosana TaxID=63359 RepID=A0AAP0N845_LIQFO